MNEWEIINYIIKFNKCYCVIYTLIEIVAIFLILYVYITNTINSLIWLKQNAIVMQKYPIAISIYYNKL